MADRQISLTCIRKLARYYFLAGVGKRNKHKLKKNKDRYSQYSRGTILKWLEPLSYGAENCWKVVGSGSPFDNWKTLPVNPAVNGYLFQFKEG